MRTPNKLNIINYLKKKSVQRFGLFFFIAFVFLVFSKLSNDHKQTIQLKISLTNVDDEIIIDNNTIPTIDAHIHAKGFSLLPFVFNTSMDLVVDAKKDVVLQPNIFLFNVEKHRYLIEEQLGVSYKVLSLSPGNIEIPYTKRASKLVPITLNTNVNYAAGYDLKGVFKLNIDSVKVVGSDVEVSKIKSLATKILKLYNVNANIEESVLIDMSSFDTVDVFPKQVSVTGNVTRFTEGTIEIPISITNKPSQTLINYFPKTIKLVYYVDLENYNAIKASDFSVECNYQAIKEGQSYFVPKLVKQPNFIKRASLRQKRIDFIKL